MFEDRKENQVSIQQEEKGREEKGLKEKQVNRNQKDGLFRMIFTDKKELLSLYNSISGRSYQDPEELKITTLTDAIYIGVKNDVSFMIDGRLSFYEHQSTWCGNMPLRNLVYISSVYAGLVAGKNLYGETSIELPSPQFIVFYNGTREREEKTILKLSDSYASKEDKEINLELKVVVLNINHGHNKELMERCKSLKDYAYYVERVRENQKSMTLKEAVEEAITHCIRNDILGEFLKKHKSEVEAVSIFECDYDTRMEQMKRDAIERGMAQGMERGMAQGMERGMAQGMERGMAQGIEQGMISVIRRKNQKGLDILQISEFLELEESYVEKIIRILEEQPNASDMEILQYMRETKVINF